MNLNRRVAKLESVAALRRPPEPVLSDEDRAAMQRIVDRTYADPVRYAKRIALFERCGMVRDEPTTLAQSGPVAGPNVARERQVLPRENDGR